MERLSDEDLPCWYEFSFINSNPAILLRIHNDFVKKSQEIPDNHPMIWIYQEKFGFNTPFDKFQGSLKIKKDFGFNNAFKYKGENDEFTEFLIEIPQIKKYTGQFCETCGGSGTDKSFDLERKCLTCFGCGKQFVYDWKSAFAVSASFTIFFQISGAFEYSGVKTTSSLKQLVVAETTTDTGDYGGRICGIYSPYFTKWLKDVFAEEFSEVKKAMMVVWMVLMNEVDDFDEYSFRVEISPRGGLILDCPGNACGLHPADSYREERKGYQFSCHNVDNPAQQMTLITGLAALCDRVRKEMK